ncbi:MAG: N-acetylmuramoyl-L-alanine amidase [Planctomycetota bacterium]
MKNGIQPWGMDVVLILMIGGFLSGCVITGPQHDQVLSFTESQALYNQGLYEEAIESVSSFLSAQGGKDEHTVQAYRLRGECYEALKRYALARADYQHAVTEAESDKILLPGRQDFIHECSIRSGDTYLHEGAYRSADLAYRKLLWKKPCAKVRDEILFRRYICAVKMNKADAEEFLGQISNRKNVDEPALRQAFLGGSPIAPVYTPTSQVPVSYPWKDLVASGQWVVIDAGHGGRDPGAVSVAGYYEKTLNLAVAKKLAEKLRNMGVRVEMTRDTDRFIELNDRAEKGNQLYAGLFVSLHADSAANSSAHGYTIYLRRSACAAEKNAARLLNGALKAAGFDSRGIRPAGFRVLTRSDGPALLVEMGFLSNPVEADRMRKGEFIETMAEALSKGIADFLRTTTYDT